MEIKLEKVSRENADWLEQILQSIFQDNATGAAANGLDYEDTDRPIPFDNRIFTYFLGNSDAEYSASSKNGVFSVLLKLNLSNQMQAVFLEQIKDRFPEIYSVLNREFHE